MRKQRKWLWSIVVFAVCCMLLPGAVVYAKEHSVPFTEGEQDITVTVGDTGSFEIPETVSLRHIKGNVRKVGILIRDYETEDKIDYGTWYDSLEEDEEGTTKILRGDEKGNFTAVNCGKALVIITLYVQREDDEELWEDDEEPWEDDEEPWDDDEEPWDEEDYYNYNSVEAFYTVTVEPDMSKVQLKSSSQTKYVDKTGGYYEMPTYTFSLNSDSVLDEDTVGTNFSCTSSNSKIRVYGELHDNKITLEPSTMGSATVTVSIYGKKFKMKISTIAVSIKKNSLLMAKGKSQTLKLSGVSSGIKWSSTNKKVATVSSKGVVKGKKAGNAVIKAKVGNVLLGCAVSVVTDKRLKVINRAKQIAKTCTYSQPKRMQSKYYDCSSLVWKAYSKYEQNFGSKSYAPVAADLALWCANRKKVIKDGITYDNTQKMKYNAGDLYFATGAPNGRYQGISHVEMISGYVCSGFDYNGKPIVEVDYVNRPAGKYYGGLVGQP